MTNNILNLSWGIQSFTLAAMSALQQTEMPDGRIIPKLDLAIFIDTTHEREATYNLQKTWTPWLQEHGINVVCETAKNPSPIYPDGHGSPMPVYMPYSNGRQRRTMLKQRCTTHWKIFTARRVIRQFMRSNHIRMAPGNITQWFGISIDEFARMKPSPLKYIQHRYPLIELRMTRDDCADWLTQHNLPVPSKSSCVFCPYQDKKSWLSLPLRPNDYAHALEIDNQIRNAKAGQQLYVHPSCQPLEDIIPLTATTTDYPDTDQVCETGYCWT